MNKELLEQVEKTKEELAKLVELIKPTTFLHPLWFSAFDTTLVDLQELIGDIKYHRS